MLITGESLWVASEKGAIQFAFVAVLGGLVGLIYSLLAKRRELAMAASDGFYRVYGSWFAIWKEWEYLWDTYPAGPPQSTREPLIRRAAETEAGFEGLLMRVASQRRLRPSQRANLARLREGFQQLRESIEQNVPLAWRVAQHFGDDRVAPYVAFKAFSVELALLLEGRWTTPPRVWEGRLVQKQKALLEVTTFRTERAGSGSTAKASWWSALRSAKSLDYQLETLDQLRNGGESAQR